MQHKSHPKTVSQEKMAPPTMRQGAFSTWKNSDGRLYGDFQVQVAQENQQSHHISIHLADISTKTALRYIRSSYSKA